MDEEVKMCLVKALTDRHRDRASMTEFWWIIKPLLVMLLQFTAKSLQIHYEFVEDGGVAVLPCDPVEPGQLRCAQPTWIHESVDTKEEVELIKHGIVGNRTTQRVNLTKECSLQMKGVRAQEAGRYTCTQYDSFGGGEPRKTLISLSIVSLSEATSSSGTQFNCSVSTNLRCTNVAVKWLDMNDMNAAETKTPPLLKVDKSNCRSTLHVRRSSHSNLRRQQITCEVTYDKKKYRYGFRAEGQEESTVLPLTTIETQTTKNGKDTPSKETTQEEQSSLGDSNERWDSEDRTASGLERWWWAAMAAVVLLIAVVSAVTWRRFKGKPVEPNSAPSDGKGVSYASISFNKSHEQHGIRANEEPVIYSSVRSAASVDPAQLHASVNKHTKQQQTGECATQSHKVVS